MLPRGRARHEAAHVGAVAGELLDGQGLGADVEAGHGHRAGGRRHDAGQHTHGGGLAGAVAPEQRGRLAGVRLEVDAGNGLDLAEAHVQAAHVDDGGLSHAENPLNRSEF